VYISIFCILFACHGKDIQSRHKNNNDSNKDCSSVSVVVDCLEVGKVMGLVGKLQEVRELERDYKVKGRKAIVLMQSPNMDTPYFWIQVGFSTSYRFEPIYNFYVSPKKGSVFFYDTMTDSIIRIEDWRKVAQKKWQHTNITSTMPTELSRFILEMRL
jgi:hypothetical protein